MNLIIILMASVLTTVFVSGCKENAISEAVTANTQDLPTQNTSNTLSSGVNAFQLVTKVDSATGSFDSVAVPTSGGLSHKATRVFDLDGSLLSGTRIPTWYSEARVFLTSTRTSAGAPTYVTSSTPCSYFDFYTTDNNADSSGYYTIDGYNASTTGVVTDIDQCAGTNAAEVVQLGMYVKLDRRFLTTTDKIQLIVKTKLVDSPNTAPTASSCIVGGNFDATACSNQVFTVSMRKAPGSSTKPFYLLFPSAKALDLLSESILLPININSDINTISVDRVKGGAIFYGLTVIKL